MHEEKDEESVLQIDLSKVKTEPEDVEFVSTEYESERPESKGDITTEQPEQLTEQVVQRFNRARYFRRNYSSPESSVCEVCQAEFGGPDVLRLHKIAHFNTATVCYVCDNMFSDTNGTSNGTKITLHMASQHKTLCTPTGNYKPEAERAFVCPMCLQRFSSNKILSLHTAKQHNGKEMNMISCKICSMDFMSTRALQTHLMSRRHKEMKIKIQSLFMCVDCRSIFPARDSYAMHMMMRAQSESCTPLETLNTTDLRPETLPRTSSSNSSNGSIARESPQPVESKHLSPNGIHREIIYRNGLSPIPMHEQKYSKGDFVCSLCNMRFYHPDTLSIHMRMSHHGMPDLTLLQRWASQQLAASNRITAPPPFLSALGFGQSTMSWTCVACGQDFHSCDALAMHVMEKHSAPAMSSSNAHLARGHYVKAPRTLHPNNGTTSNDAIALQLSKNKRTTINNNSPMNSPINKDKAKYTKRRSSALHVEEASESPTDVDQPAIAVDQQPAKRRKSEAEDLTIPDKETSEFFSKCSFCQETFTEKALLIAHIKECTPLDPHLVLQCQGCHNKFETVSRYSAHPCTSDHESSDEAIKCLICNEVLSATKMITHFKQGNKCAQLPSLQLATKGNTKQDQNLKYDKKVPVICQPENNEDKQTHQTEKKEQLNHEVKVVKKKPVTEIETKDTTTDSSMQQSPRAKTPEEIAVVNESQEKDTIIKSLVQDAIEMKRNRRKTRPATRLISNNSPETDWQGSESPTQDLNQGGLIAIPVSPASSPTLKEALPALASATESTALDATGHENLQGQSLFNYVLANSPNLIMCKYCEIIYTNRTMYYLHMGLHNLNNPWQCNLCGKVCANVHEFSSHVIHYR